MTVLYIHYTLESESQPIQSSRTYLTEILWLTFLLSRTSRIKASLHLQYIRLGSQMYIGVHNAGSLGQRVVAGKQTLGNHPRNNRSMFCIIKLIIHVKVGQHQQHQSLCTRQAAYHLRKRFRSSCISPIRCISRSTQSRTVRVAQDSYNHL